MNPQLPPLPEPHQPASPAYKDGSYELAAIPAKFTDDQMHAFGLQCAEAERARCADICKMVSFEEKERRQHYASMVAYMCAERIQGK